MCIIFIIFALLDTVFCESSVPRSAQDKQRRAKKTFEEMMNYIPGIHSLLPGGVLPIFRLQDKCTVKTRDQCYVLAGKFISH